MIYYSFLNWSLSKSWVGLDFSAIGTRGRRPGPRNGPRDPLRPETAAKLRFENSIAIQCDWRKLIRPMAAKVAFSKRLRDDFLPN